MGFFEVLNGINQGINIASSIMGGTNAIFNNFGFSSPFNIENLNTDPLYPNVDYNLQDKLSESPLLYYFNRFIYGLEGYTPDINGYTLIFMQPPDLSGISDVYTTSQVTRLISFLAVDFTPPTQQVLVGDVSGGGSGIAYGTDVITAGGSLQISYLDTCTLDMFNLHKTWLDYIRAVTKGTISPSGRYLISGEIDYSASAYVIRFKPVATQFSLDDIVYVGKAVGIFPVGLPDKEVIGRRDQNELTVLPIQYQCVEYRQMTSAANDPQGWIWDEFVQIASSDVNGGGGSSMGFGGFGSEVNLFGSTVSSVFSIANDVGKVASMFGNNKISKEVNRVRGQVSTAFNAVNQTVSTANRVANIFGF